MSLPLYYKIYRELQFKIGSGELPSNSVLPTDAELQDHYGVSRAPVRQALKALEIEGLIIRGAGKRTYVADRKRENPWFTECGFTHHFEKEWDNITCKTLNIGLKKSEQEISTFLGIPQKQDIVFCERIRLVKEIPVVFMQNHFSIFYNIDVFSRAGDFLSLKELFFCHFHKEFSEVEENLVAIAAEGIISDHLKVSEGTPILKLTRYSYDLEKRPLTMDYQFIRTDIWQYKNTIKQKRSI